ncbi:DUF4166 domain-containing protein [Lysobacter sp. yr284]|uniref:DUF4166 domain-containing protein n=1 Tax=Lysobacter sp. yr284 TaxID=1761791 RepID=UPI00111429B1|nr:DUF4166 domain-containing protein [Lysobacter sp. yr284]
MSRQQESPTRMPGEPHNAAIGGFCPAFDRLPPLLQTLHRDGGALAGGIELRTGRGLAGVIGQRLARTLGIPLGLRARDLPLPRFLFSRTDARTRIERIDGEERYRFAVAFSWFPFGELLRYPGALHAVPAVTAPSAASAGAANVAAHCSAQRVTS